MNAAKIKTNLAQSADIRVENIRPMSKAKALRLFRAEHGRRPKRGELAFNHYFETWSIPKRIG